MRFPKGTPVLIVLLGCGGTGGYIVRDLCRLLYALERPIRLILADADKVEEKNLIRQNFTPADLAANKAEVLAERYSGAFGLQLTFVPKYIESSYELKRLLTPQNIVVSIDSDGRRQWEQETPILVGAVDNFKTRQLCDQCFQSLKDLIYIDAGNAEYIGQIVCGVKRKGKLLYPPLSAVHPDILEKKDKFPSELSCAEAAASSPQAIMTNLFAAMGVLDMLYKLLAEGNLDIPEVNFSSKSISMQPNLSYRRKAPQKKLSKLPQAA